MSQVDMVNSPPHYIGAGGMESIDVIEAYPHVRCSFHLGSACKYIFRAPHKGEYARDLRKAAWFLRRVLDKVFVPRPWLAPTEIRYSVHAISENFSIDLMSARGRTLNIILLTCQPSQLRVAIDLLEAEAKSADTGGADQEGGA